MLSASEAFKQTKERREKLLKDELLELEKSILSAISDGEYSIIVKSLSEEAYKSLNMNGYIIKGVSGSGYSISWKESHNDINCPNPWQ